MIKPAEGFITSGVSVLAGCGGSPFRQTEGVTAPGDTTESGIPAGLAGNLGAAAFVPAAQILTITLRSVNGSPVGAIYTRDMALYVAIYETRELGLRLGPFSAF